MQISSIFESVIFIPNKVEQTPRSAHFSRCGRRSKSSVDLFMRRPLISNSTHCDSGTMYASMFFGVKNWFMKRRSWIHCSSEIQALGDCLKMPLNSHLDDRRPSSTAKNLSRNSGRCKQFLDSNTFSIKSGLLMKTFRWWNCQSFDISGNDEANLFVSMNASALERIKIKFRHNLRTLASDLPIEAHRTWGNDRSPEKAWTMEYPAKFASTTRAEISYFLLISKHIKLKLPPVTSRTSVVRLKDDANKAPNHLFFSITQILAE